MLNACCSKIAEAEAAVLNAYVRVCLCTLSGDYFNLPAALEVGIHVQVVELFGLTLLWRDGGGAMLYVLSFIKKHSPPG